jgi:branched-chain amino acid transport system permease protein
MQQITVQALNGMALGMLLFLVAGGLTVIFGLLRVINLAHGSFYLLGAYLGLSTYAATDNFLFSLVAAPIGVAVLAVIVDVVLRQRLYGQQVNQVLATLGIAFILGDLLLWWYGGAPRSMATPGPLRGSIELGLVTYPRYRFALIVIGLAFAAIVAAIWTRTRVGALLRAGVDDADMLEAMGVPVRRLFTGTFVIGSALAAVAGVIGGPFLGAYPGLDFDVLLWSVVIVVVGGLGSPLGAFIASILIGMIDSFSRSYVPELSYFILFGPVILILAFRPRGIIASRATR